jgi:hypothetical protein
MNITHDMDTAIWIRYDAMGTVETWWVDIVGHMTYLLKSRAKQIEDHLLFTFLRLRHIIADGGGGVDLNKNTNFGHTTHLRDVTPDVLAQRSIIPTIHS